MQISKIILGIDPGTNVLGYGNIKITGQKLELINLGVVKLDKINDPYEKLSKIFERIQHIITHYRPDEIAIEAPFYGKNVQSMLKLGRAQGVAIAAGLTLKIPVFEYAPKKIKQSITGNGNASKEQVAAMLKNLLKFDQSPKFLDATDALSVAVCHYFQNNNKALFNGKKFKSWKDFLVANPGRTKKS